MNKYEQAKNVCIALISGDQSLPDIYRVREIIQQAHILFQLSDEEKIKLEKELKHHYAISSDEPRIIDYKPPVQWVKNAKAEISWNFWNRYRSYLEMQQYAPDTINKLDNLTDDILDRTGRPGHSNLSEIRGLVVGHVQSGKTGNYIGLICKAADAGYRLIIVLAGIHSSLRSQTQLRIDEGFLGFDTKQARSITKTSNRIGVGNINPKLIAHSLTTSEINGDFNRRASETSGINIHSNDPIILVVKKNASVLKNLLAWLYSRAEKNEKGEKNKKSPAITY